MISGVKQINSWIEDVNAHLYCVEEEESESAGVWGLIYNRILQIQMDAYFSFNAFKLFRSLTDLIGDDRLICTFRSLCCDSNFALSAVFPTIFRKYLHSARCIESFAVADDGGGHSPFEISLLTLARTIWATRPRVGVVWILLLVIFSGTFCVEWFSNKFFLPITVLDRFRFGDFDADDKDDDDDDDVETIDAVDIRNEATSSSSLRLLKGCKKNHN